MFHCWKCTQLLCTRLLICNSNLTLICFPVMISPSAAVEGGHTYSAKCKFIWNICFYSLFSIVLQTILVVPPCKGLSVPNLNHLPSIDLGKWMEGFIIDIKYYDFLLACTISTFSYHETLYTASSWLTISYILVC